MVCSTVTNSRNGTSGDALAVEPGSGSALASPERTRNASSSSGLVRLASGSCRTMFTSSFSRGTWSKSTDSPPTAIRSVSEMVSALMPWRAAFSLSMTKRTFGWSASIYQSVSTTPGVLWKISMTFCASASRLYSSARRFRRRAFATPAGRAGLRPRPPARRISQRWPPRADAPVWQCRGFAPCVRFLGQG